MWYNLADSKGDEGMEDKKKDQILIIAIVLFLVIIIILCVVRLNARKKNGEENGSLPQESVETLYESRESESTLPETETQTQTQTEPDQAAAAAESEPAGGEETETLENQLPSGKVKQENASEKKDEARTINGKDPFAGAESANKTNEEMLMEMSGYWEQRNMEAVDDLAHLGWFMKMSAGISDESTFYYYGERNGLGQPNGTGIACYSDNAYYYGQWVDGKREGRGEWIRFYMYYDDDAASDRAYVMHMYAGEWADDMPNGEGQEHYDLDMSQAAKKERYLQNVIGTFQDGLYSGEMYLTTLNWQGNQEEWNGMAEEGIWSPYGAATNAKEVPICRDVDDENNYLWIAVRNNKDRGINELMP